MTKKASQAMLDAVKRSTLLRQAVQGRQSASSTSLSRSYGAPLDEVRAILRSSGVRDDG